MGVTLLYVLVLAPLWVYAGYLLVLTLASFLPGRLAQNDKRFKFAFVVPAHNEAAGISRTVENLLAVDYPDRQVWVVADNCTDDTAALARAAGAHVLERHDATKKAKGYALEHAFNHFFAAADKPDAVVVVDADSIVSPNLLTAFARHFANGAQAVQADYAVGNPEASWRTRLMRIALAMFHILRSLGRERLQVSCGLRGNGMAFTLPLLQRVPYSAYSLVEDLEYGIVLGRAGIRVEYAEDAHVYGDMVAQEKASRSQRDRWERGRKDLKRAIGWKVVGEAFAQRSKTLLDLALDLKCPPLSQLAVAAAVTAALGLLTPAPWLGLFAPACLLLYVARGWQLSGTGLRGLSDLAFAPIYIFWKLTLPLRHGKKRDAWVRTTRE